jgi:hypothetical protein
MTTLDQSRQIPQANEAKQLSRRIGGVAGLTFLALYFVSAAILAGAYGQTDSLEQVQRVFAEQADTIDIACALLLLSTPLLLVFATALQDTASTASDRGVSALVLPSGVAGAALILVGAALMGGTSFLAESATVDGRSAAFAHSAAEACLFYAIVFFGTFALSVAASSAGRLPAWYRITAIILGTGMLIGSAASPLVRDLAFLAGMSSYLFFLVTGVMMLLGDRGRTAPLGR